MKIIVKTLQGKQTEYEVDATATVDVLKKKIAEATGVDPSSLKLIYEGTLLADGAKQLTAYGIKDPGFLVLVANKVLSVLQPIAKSY